MRQLPTAIASTATDRAFRDGQGYNSLERDGLTNFATSPKRVHLELADTGFRREAVEPSARGPTFVVPWPYCVGRR